MSAFFVGTDHIDAILSVLHLDARCDGIPLPDGNYGRSNNSTHLTEIGRALLAENIKSLQARYRSDWQEMVNVDVNEYRFRFDFDFAGKPNAIIALIKLLDCLDYQSCEHDGWSESYAKRFVNWATAWATHKLPGYEAAPWGYERPAGASRGVTLSSMFS